MMYYSTRFALGGVFGGSGVGVRRGFLSGIDLANLGFVAGGLMIEADLANVRMLTDFKSFELGLLFGLSVRYGLPR